MGRTASRKNRLRASSPIIFFIEEHPSFGPIVDPFFEAVSKGQIKLVTSAVALLEVLIHPLRHNDEHLAQRYNDILLCSPNISTISVTSLTAQVAAGLLASSNLKTPDANPLGYRHHPKRRCILDQRPRLPQRNVNSDFART